MKKDYEQIAIKVLGKLIGYFIESLIIMLVWNYFIAKILTIDFELTYFNTLVLVLFRNMVVRVRVEDMDKLIEAINERD